MNTIKLNLALISVLLFTGLAACGGGGGSDGSGGGGSTTKPIGRCIDPDNGLERDIVSPGVGQLKISEWMPDPTAVVDTSGEWFELNAKASFDLNGLQAGTTALDSTLIPTSGTCVKVSNGAYVIFAHDAVAANNGYLPGVTGTFTFSLINSSGQLRIGIGGIELQSVSWASSSPGASIQIDSDGTQCNAPGGTPAYNSVDIGTPAGPHSLECS